MGPSLKKSQHGLKVIRRFQEDIWGILAIKNKPSSVLNFIYEAYQNNFKHKKLLKETQKSFFLVRKRGKFLYKVVTEEQEFKRRKKTLKTNNYLNSLKLRRFYGNLGRRKIVRSLQSLSVLPNSAMRSFPFFLESRLDAVLYRSNFFNSIFSAKQFINHNKIYVNGYLVSKPGFRLNIGDVVTIKNVSSMYTQLVERLNKEKLLINYPSYLYINYKLGSIKLTRLPRHNEVPFPFFINIKTMSHNFFKQI